MRHPFFILLLLVTALGALALRVPGLGQRPMHADEAVHAAILRQLWERGRYVYDPYEFHGPTLVYSTLPAMWCCARGPFADTTETLLRIVPAVFGSGLVLLLWPLANAIGRWAVLSAAVFTATSPAMVFYSRYYIHETLLVFFTLGLIVACWRCFESGRLVWYIVAGIFAGLMQATKETCILTFAAMIVALGLTRLWNRGGGPIRPTPFPSRPYVVGWAAGLLAAMFVAATLLSSFFTNPRGPIDGVLTYVPWFDRAAGSSPHIHPWYFYLRILTWRQIGDGPLWSEVMILVLAGVGMTTALLPVKWNLLPDASVPFVRWLGFYAVTLTVIYSAIPYKTPWCLLSFLHGMILLAGIGVVAWLRFVPTMPLKLLMGLCVLAGTAHLSWQAHQAGHAYAADPVNPYVYAHTSPDILRLAQDVEQLAKASPEGHATLVKVIWNDAYYWPLPWYLRRFDRVGFWTHEPDQPAAPLVIAAPEFDASITEKLDATHLMTGYYEVRPNVLAQLWVRMDLWEAHLRRLGRL